MISLFKNGYSAYLDNEDLVSKSHSLVSLAARVYIAYVFFSAGLTKIRDWDSTLLLFEYEYQVPVIPFELAAWLGTAGELVLPVLLFAGLLTRFSAVGLFFVNIVAVISLEDIAPAALYLHYIWGVVMLQTIIYGAGIFSIDGVAKRFIGSASGKTQPAV